MGGDIFVIDVEGHHTVRLTDADGWDGSPAWSNDGQTIYFYSERDGLPQIWRMQQNGEDQENLGGPPGLSPTVMSNGRIAFSSPAMGEDGPDLSSWRAVSIAADGTDVRLEGPTNQDSRGPRFRPGTEDLVCYGVSPGQDLLDSYLATPLLRARGQRLRVPLPDRTLDVQGLHRHFPAISPDGREIVSSVLVSANEAAGIRLIAAPVDGGGGRELHRTEQFAWHLGLSWAGEWIAFGTGAALAPVGSAADVWKVRRDGTGAENLTSGSAANDAWPDFSADGGRIVFRSGRDGNHEIYLMDADGSDLHRLTDDPGLDSMPALSPKGDQVAFSSNRDGEHAHADFDVYLLDLTAAGEPGRLRRLTHSPGPDMHVRFSPDGEWIVYTSQRGGFNDELYLSFTDAGQTYGEIFAQRLSDGLVVRLTHNKWEDGPVAWGLSPTR